MQRRTLMGFAVIVAAATVLAVVREADRTPPPDRPTALGCRSRSVGERGSGEFVLRLALVQMEGLTEAILDAVEIPLTAAGTFDVDLGFQTPSDAKRDSGFRFPSGIAARQPWRSRIRQTRQLPPEFDGITLHLDLRGAYHGADGGVHLLTLDEFEGHAYRFGPGYSSGGTLHLPVHRVAMHEDVPIARVYPDDGLAWLAVVSRARSGAVGNPGEREWWRQAFAEAVGHASADREAIRAAVEAVQPSWQNRPCSAAEFLAWGPALDRFTAGFVLRDAAVFRSLRESLAADPRPLDEAREASRAQMDGQPSGWFIEQVGDKWLDFLSGLVAGSTEGVSGFFVDRETVLLRLLELTDDATIAEAVVDRVLPGAREMRVRQLVLENAELGRTEPVRAEFARLRSAVVSSLDPPWSLLLRSTPWLVAWCLLVPLLALGLVLRRKNPRGEPFRVTRTQIFVLGVGSFVTLSGFPLKVLLVPAWWLFAGQLLSQPRRQGLLERVVVWLALTLVTVEALQDLGWFVKAPPLDVALDSGLYFCWIMVGLGVLADGRWRNVHRFTWFLLLLMVLDCARLLIAPPGEPPAVLVGLVLLAMLALAGFWASGPGGGGMPPAVPRPGRSDA